MRPRFWELPLSQLTGEEWEALCDGCGRCCLHKVEEETTGAFLPTNVACRLLDRHSCRCSSYKQRKRFVPDCLRLTPEKLPNIGWLPESCAYVRRQAGEPLPAWHYLLTGDREAVHAAGESARGWTVSEDQAGDYLDHLVDRPL
ncbi:MAG: UPF0260 protein YcgN [uncultured Sphingomonadaceae bacterium]|uniref:UPF0260 protein YcgN n=1 Tax=uncultured Sphingomonadaceae bacterium TaxID=169976 RepID=A0A6J4SZ67_9SPHN|nr:MAG: UPF0260 protein YcgN [uncultured Sphingomonadaceae bacterium]